MVAPTTTAASTSDGGTGAATPVPLVSLGQAGAVPSGTNGTNPLINVYTPVDVNGTTTEATSGTGATVPLVNFGQDTGALLGNSSRETAPWST
ncbi:MAG: hypothetical protein ACRDVW_01785 [Acidimicrobiales bacterium]